MAVVVGNWVKSAYNNDLTGELDDPIVTNYETYTNITFVSRAWCRYSLDYSWSGWALINQYNDPTHPTYPNDFIEWNRWTGSRVNVSDYGGSWVQYANATASNLGFNRKAAAYNVKVRCVSKTPWGDSVATREVTVPKLDAPAGATGLTGSGNVSATHYISWTASADNRTAGYKIYQSINGGAYSLVDTITGLSKSFSSRTPGYVYTYKVVAYNVGGDSSTQPTGTLYGAIIAPSAMQITGYTAPSSVSGSFKNDNNYPVAAVVEKSGDNTNWSNLGTYSLAAGETKAWSDTNAPAGMAYYRSKFTSPSSSAYGSTVSQQTITTPDAPTDLSGDVALGSVSVTTMSWVLHNTVEKPIDIVRWQWSSDGGVTWNIENHLYSQVTTTSRNMIKNERLRFRVRTENVVGVSAWVTSNDFYGYTNDISLSGTVIGQTSGKPVSFKTDINVPAYIRPGVVKLVGGFYDESNIKVYDIAARVVTPSVTYQSEIPYFDAAKVLTDGEHYTFRFHLTDDAGTTISSTVVSTALLREAIVGAETGVTWNADNTACIFQAATPYECKREVELKVWAYKDTGAASMDDTNLISKALSTSTPSIALSNYLKKVPYINYEWVVRGYYDNNTLAYTSTGVGELKKGVVFYLGDTMLKSHLIDENGIVEVFADVIEAGV